MHKGITIESMLNKSPRKNRKIRPKNITLKRMGFYAALAGLFALECYTGNYLGGHTKFSYQDTQSAYSGQIETKAYTTPAIKEVTTKTIIKKPITIAPPIEQIEKELPIAVNQDNPAQQENIEQKCKGIPKLNIPNNIPDYLAKAIAEHEDFRLTQAEEKMVAKWDPLINYVSTIDFFNQGNYVDPLFMKAIVAVESRGDPKACSHVKARGISQVRYWIGKPYCEWIAENENIDLEQIAQDIKELGYDSSRINKKTLKNLRAKYLHNSPLNVILLKYAIDLNYKRFGDRPDLHCGEWNAGLTNGIVNKQMANIQETKEHFAKINALYNGWHNPYEQRALAKAMDSTTKVALKTYKPENLKKRRFYK